MGEENNKMIGIIDYGMGNVNAFKNIYYENGIDVRIINDPKNIDKDIKKIILPGVGSFDYAMQSLRMLGFLEKISEFLQNEKNLFLGICVGMQVLCKLSDEGLEKGMGIFQGKVQKFQNISTPHMGWNRIKIIKHDKILNEIPDNSEFYFLHSFYLQNTDNINSLCLTDYKDDFSSIIKKNNIYGIQFHPEKSHKLGEKLLLNFHNI